jgi:hypothetical protein
VRAADGVAHGPSMRTRWMRAIAFSDLRPLEKLTAYTIGQRMTSEGECHPSVPKIAEESGLTVAAVKRHRKAIRRSGLLEFVSGRGQGHLTRYTAAIPAGLMMRIESEGKGVTAEPFRDGKGVSSVTERGQQRHTKGVTADPRSRSTEVHKEGASRFGRKEPDRFHRACGDCDCQRCRDLGYGTLKPEPLTEEAPTPARVAILAEEVARDR